MGLRFITSDVKNAYFKIHLTLFPSLMSSCEAVAFAVSHGLIVKIEAGVRQPSFNETGRRELNKRG